MEGFVLGCPQLADLAVEQGAHVQLLPLLRASNPELRASAAFAMGVLLPARHYEHRQQQPQPMGSSPHSSLHSGMYNGHSEMGSESLWLVRRRHRLLLSTWSRCSPCAALHPVDLRH